MIMSKPTYKYLKDKTYYNELYDRFTIEECRRWESKEDVKDRKRPKGEDPKLTALKKKFSVKIVIPIALYFLQGERYRNKSKTISEWMERDRARDEKIANAVEPRGIRCLGCSSPMDCESRDLHTDLDPAKDRVLFFFNCPRCHRKRAYWEGGEEWEPSPNPCPKCKKADLESSYSRSDNVVTTTYSCSSCKYKETDKLDLDKKREETIDPNFEADRKKYCMSEKEGEEYISSMLQLKNVVDMMKDHEENKEVYDAIDKIKKLTIAELQNLLSPLVKKAGYIKFELGKPEITRDVVIEFSTQDNKPDRAEYDSKHDLQKIIKKALEGTNWRLMSDGISYRLGFLTGRLRGMESKEDLINLVKRRKTNYSE